MLNEIVKLAEIANKFQYEFEMFSDIDVRADSFAVEVHFRNTKLILVTPEGEIVVNYPEPIDGNTAYIINKCLEMLGKGEIFESNGKWYYDDWQELHHNYRMTTY